MNLFVAGRGYNSQSSLYMPWLYIITISNTIDSTTTIPHRIIQSYQIRNDWNTEYLQIKFYTLYPNNLQDTRPVQCIVGQQGSFYLFHGTQISNFVLEFQMEIYSIQSLIILILPN